MKTCQILVDPGATLSTSNIPQSLQMGSWENWQKPVKCRNFYKSLLSRISVCDAWWREKNKISCCPFLFKSRPIGYRSLVSQRTEVTFLFVLRVLRTWLSNHQVKGPSIWPDRNLSLTPFAAGPYQIDASHQENYLRFFFFFFWLFWWMALNLGRIISFALFGDSFCPHGVVEYLLPETSMYCLSSWILTGYSKDFTLLQDAF